MRSEERNFPEFENPDKQEAARFLCTDIDARPVIRGIHDPERLKAWTYVAKELDITGQQRRALRQRWQSLQRDEADDEVAFEPASEIEADAQSEAAVADGGAVVEADDEANTCVSQSDGWEIGPDQEAMTYEDEAEFQSKKNDKRRTVEDLVETVDDAESALDTQYQKDVVPIHTVELLEERLEELRGERDE